MRSLIIFLPFLLCFLDGFFASTTAKDHDSYFEPAFRIRTFLRENSDLPDNSVSALTETSDKALWVGTSGGLARFRLPKTRPVTTIIGLSERQSHQTFAAWAFDPAYETEPQTFRYHWSIRCRQFWGREKTVYDSVTRSPVLTYEFQDGHYTLVLRAIDRYGFQSEAKEVGFRVAIPKPTSPIAQKLKKLGAFAAFSSIIYLFALFPLLRMYPKWGWPRTAVNSGLFNKFPLLHKSIISCGWARRHLFQDLAQSCIQSAAIPKPYVPQAIYRGDDPEAQPITIGIIEESIGSLFGKGRHVLVLGRTGTGKTVFLRYLLRLMAMQFLNVKKKERNLPILIDLRTHPIAGRTLEDVICDVLRGYRVELSDDVIKFLIKKGGFLVLVDSLNEINPSILKNEFQSFLNRNANNKVLMASQLNFLKRRDTQMYNMAELNAQQAREYLCTVLSSDPWERLPAEVQALGRNPQDLALISEVLLALPPEEVPTHRADLYRELLHRDAALIAWVHSESVEILLVYALAFRMFDEAPPVVSEDDLPRWVRRLMEERSISESVTVDAIVEALQKSRMFKQEQVPGTLGIPRIMIGFQHELMGKFLAARHLRSLLERGADASMAELTMLSGEPRWLDVFFFVIDELNSSLELNQFLMSLIRAGGLTRIRLVAFALGTKPPELIQSEVRELYSKAKLEADLHDTPAALGT